MITILRANALALPLADSSVDLVVTSPPYFGLRSYQDGGEHYEGQIGSEATPAEFVDALIAATREMVRVLKPSGSIWVNLGDKYAASGTMQTKHGLGSSSLSSGVYMDEALARPFKSRRIDNGPVRNKSLLLLPERYRIRAVDELGLIARAVVIWSKPNGLPESVTDRVRRSHEDWVHLTKQPRYFSAVDEIREEYAPGTAERYRSGYATNGRAAAGQQSTPSIPLGVADLTPNALGKLPGSVWTIPTEPLRVPDHLGIDHFAAFPTEWPRRIISGWSPREVCTACGEGRRPVSVALGESARDRMNAQGHNGYTAPPGQQLQGGHAQGARARELTGYDCACPDTSAPATPGVVLDVFGGTGTTALVADVLGRDGITVDLSADYCRLAEWRTTDPKQRAKAARVEAVEPVSDNQPDLFGGAA